MSFERFFSSQTINIKITNDYITNRDNLAQIKGVYFEFISKIVKINKINEINEINNINIINDINKINTINKINKIK